MEKDANAQASASPVSAKACRAIAVESALNGAKLDAQ
jgi:hypothetical protein